MELSNDEFKEVNIFLSNFGEVYLEDFLNQTFDKNLINFAVGHVYINNYKTVKIDDNIGYLDRAIVERNIRKYFGKILMYSIQVQIDSNLMEIVMKFQ